VGITKLAGNKCDLKITALSLEIVKLVATCAVRAAKKKKHCKASLLANRSAVVTE
jgi:hypothetical protein